MAPYPYFQENVFKITSVDIALFGGDNFPFAVYNYIMKNTSYIKNYA